MGWTIQFANSVFHQVANSSRNWSPTKLGIRCTKPNNLVDLETDSTHNGYLAKSEPSFTDTTTT